MDTATAMDVGMDDQCPQLSYAELLHKIQCRRNSFKEKLWAVLQLSPGLASLQDSSSRSLRKLLLKASAGGSCLLSKLLQHLQQQPGSSAWRAFRSLARAAWEAFYTHDSCQQRLARVLAANAQGLLQECLQPSTYVAAAHGSGEACSKQDQLERVLLVLVEVTNSSNSMVKEEVLRWLSAGQLQAALLRYEPQWPHVFARAEHVLRDRTLAAVCRLLLQLVEQQAADQLCSNAFISSLLQLCSCPVQPSWGAEAAASLLNYLAAAQPETLVAGLRSLPAEAGVHELLQLLSIGGGRVASKATTALRAVTQSAYSSGVTAAQQYLLQRLAEGRHLPHLLQMAAAKQQHGSRALAAGSAAALLVRCYEAPQYREGYAALRKHIMELLQIISGATRTTDSAASRSLDQAGWAAAALGGYLAQAASNRAVLEPASQQQDTCIPGLLAHLMQALQVMIDDLAQDSSLWPTSQIATAVSAAVSCLSNGLDLATARNAATAWGQVLVQQVPVLVRMRTAAEHNTKGRSSNSSSAGSTSSGQCAAALVAALTQAACTAAAASNDTLHELQRLLLSEDAADQCSVRQVLLGTASTPRGRSLLMQAASVSALLKIAVQGLAVMEKQQQQQQPTLEQQQQHLQPWCRAGWAVAAQVQLPDSAATLGVAVLAVLQALATDAASRSDIAVAVFSARSPEGEAPLLHMLLWAAFCGDAETARAASGLLQAVTAAPKCPHSTQLRLGLQSCVDDLVGVAQYGPYCSTAIMLLCRLARSASVKQQLLKSLPVLLTAVARRGAGSLISTTAAAELLHLLTLDQVEDGCVVFSGAAGSAALAKEGLAALALGLVGHSMTPCAQEASLAALCNAVHAVPGGSLELRCVPLLLQTLQQDEPHDTEAAALFALQRIMHCSSLTFAAHFGGALVRLLTEQPPAAAACGHKLVQQLLHYPAAVQQLSQQPGLLAGLARALVGELQQRQHAGPQPAAAKTLNALAGYRPGRSVLREHLQDLLAALQPAGDGTADAEEAALLVCSIRRLVHKGDGLAVVAQHSACLAAVQQQHVQWQAAEAAQEFMATHGIRNPHAAACMLMQAALSHQ